MLLVEANSILYITIKIFENRSQHSAVLKKKKQHLVLEILECYHFELFFFALNSLLFYSPQR